MTHGAPTGLRITIQVGWIKVEGAVDHEADPEVAFGRFELNDSQHSLSIDGREIELREKV